MRRWVAAIALALTAVIGMPSVAHADEAECAGSSYAEGGYELFRTDPSYVPPPLHPFTPDCASRFVGSAFNDDSTTGFNYYLVWVDIPWSEFVAIVRSFEQSEWAEPGLITRYDFAGGGAQTFDTDTSRALSADDLAGLPPLEYASARFSNATTLQDVVALTYTDGVIFDNDVAFDVPSLVVQINVDHTFDSTQLDDPSTLSDLPTIAEAAPTGVQWAAIGTGSLVLMLVVGWPSTLLNSVVGSRYQQLQRWVRGLFRRRGPAEPVDPVPGRPAVRQSRLPGWLMWPGFALAAILGAFVDPDFGLNLMSLRLVGSLFLSFLLFNLAAWWVVRRVAVRLQPDSDPYLRFRWGSLFLVVVAVLVARLLGLEPGVIFGLVAGVAYATTLQAAKSAVVTIAGSAFGLALAVVAWAGYSILSPIPVDNALYVFLVEFLAGVTVKGVSTLPLALLPLGSLDGAKLFGWRKAVWALCYVVGLAAFMVVLATVPKSWGEVPDFVRWVWIFGAYALVALVIWIVSVVHLRRKPLPPEKEQGDQPDAITID